MRIPILVRRRPADPRFSTRTSLAASRSGSCPLVTLTDLYARSSCNRTVIARPIARCEKGISKAGWGAPVERVAIGPTGHRDYGPVLRNGTHDPVFRPEAHPVP